MLAPYPPLQPCPQSPQAGPYAHTWRRWARAQWRGTAWRAGRRTSRRPSGGRTRCWPATGCPTGPAGAKRDWSPTGMPAHVRAGWASPEKGPAPGLHLPMLRSSALCNNRRPAAPCSALPLLTAAAAASCSTGSQQLGLERVQSVALGAASWPSAPAARCVLAQALLVSQTNEMASQGSSSGAYWAPVGGSMKSGWVTCKGCTANAGPLGDGFALCRPICCCAEWSGRGRLAQQLLSTLQSAPLWPLGGRAQRHEGSAEARCRAAAAAPRAAAGCHPPRRLPAQRPPLPAVQQSHRFPHCCHRRRRCQRLRSLQPPPQHPGRR